MSFHLHFLGTGDAFNTGGRGSACLRVQPANDPAFLVDLGPTALQAMERERLEAKDIGSVFLTHMHGDHIAGWPFFLLHNSFATPRVAPLDVYGARGMTERLAALTTVCYGDILKPERLPFEIRHHELDLAPAADLKTTSGSLRFDTLPMDHHPTSLGYRFHAEGACVAVSGDTRWNPALKGLSVNADLLLLECTTVARQAQAHISLEELREGRGDLGAKRILLVHTSDPVAEALAEDPIEGVQVAEDGMRVEIG